MVNTQLFQIFNGALLNANKAQSLNTAALDDKHGGISADILAARQPGVVHCGISSLPLPTVTAIAREFGLRDVPECYREVDEAAAKSSLVRLLHQDMAYNAEIMPLSQASWFADRFLAQFKPGSRYFTNNWCSVTGATFDEGILILGPACSGCLWVEDED